MLFQAGQQSEDICPTPFASTIGHVTQTGNDVTFESVSGSQWLKLRPFDDQNSSMVSMLEQAKKSAPFCEATKIEAVQSDNKALIERKIQRLAAPQIYDHFLAICQVE